MINSLLLNQKIEDSGLKRCFIAEQMGISAFSLAKKIENKTEFTVSEMNSLCKILSISNLKVRESIFFADEVD